MRHRECECDLSGAIPDEAGLWKFFFCSFSVRVRVLKIKKVVRTEEMNGEELTAVETFCGAG